jgi:two-component sensor histidine kinase
MRRDETDATGSKSAAQRDAPPHRLRDHLQNMISLISLQMRRAQHPEAVHALEDLRARFTALTSIYIDLDDASDRPIALDQFIPGLVRRIAELYDPAGERVVSFAVAPVSLSGQRAELLGQILVELAMNVYSHAFAARIGGKVDVALTIEGDDVCLVVSDDGPRSIEPDGSRAHLGFSIISNLAGALGGTFTHESRGGFNARLRFRRDSAAAPS